MLLDALNISQLKFQKVRKLESNYYKNKILANGVECDTLHKISETLCYVLDSALYVLKNKTSEQMQFFN